MFIRRFPRSFRRLQGKLTLSYTLTSVVTFLVLEGMFITAVFLFTGFNVTGFAQRYLQQEALQASPYFVHGSPDREAVTSWLHIVSRDLSDQWVLGHSDPILLAVADTQGRTVASVGLRPVSPETSIQTQLSSQSRANLRTVLNQRKGTTGIAGQEADGAIVAIAPIVGNGEDVVGTLVMKIARPDRLRQFTGFLQLIMVTVTIVTLIAAIAGMVFGYLTARGLTHRLAGLSDAAHKWSQGDFSALTHDASEDELGQVARQLNRMAEQLQNLFQARQELATLEERNRLARDLHDSVKQQIFALAMQIGATKVLLKRDVVAAEGSLNEAQTLVIQAQQELGSLIRQLRPVALEGKGLIVALRELATEWSQRTGIVANLRVEGTQTLPLPVEEALFRVAQEALTNVARHSKATLVQMSVTLTGESVMLSVIDNGQGFDTTRHKHLGVGLLSMQERMRALGGDVQIESTSQKGTHVIAFCKQLSIDTDNVPAAPDDVAAR
jgi:NarL family two-component system sensor histidine kinase LiaS